MPVSMEPKVDGTRLTVKRLYEYPVDLPCVDSVNGYYYGLKFG